MMWWRKPTIEFFCLAEDYGALVEPVSAGKVLPTWYRAIPPFHTERRTLNDTGITIKRCVPFLEAMTHGWIVSTTVDINVELSNGGKTVKTSTTYPRPIISTHDAHQVAGSPMADRSILKFDTGWCVRTSPGYSCLITPPLNRNPDVVTFAAIIQTDTYNQQLSIPFYFNRTDGLFTLPKGTPLVQIMPFKRETIKSTVRVATNEEMVRVEAQRRSVLAGLGWYRKHVKADA